MKANVQWKYPEGVSHDDTYVFKVKETITLPLLSRYETDTMTTFLAEKTVKGTPAIAFISNEKGKKVVEGVIVSDPDGAYVIPKRFISKESTPLLETAHNALNRAEDDLTEVADEVASEVDKFDTKKVLGFTRKQLLVMAVAVLIVVKIAK